MQSESLIFVVISIIGAALINNLTTFEASAQGGIMGLVARGSQDVILSQQDCPPERPNCDTVPSGQGGSGSNILSQQDCPPERPNCDTVPPGQGVPAQGGLMGLIANSAQDVYTPGGSLSCSEGQVLDEQSGFCVPKELETAEEQQEGQEEAEQPEQQSFDDEGDGLDDTSNDDNSGNDEDDN